MTALLGLDLTQLQELITAGNVDETIFQDICTSMSQIEIDSSLKGSEEIDPKLLETLKTQLESLLQTLKNSSNELESKDQTFVKVFAEKLELLLNETNASTKPLEVKTSNASDQDVVPLKETSPDLLEKVKAILVRDGNQTDKVSTDVKGSELKESVEGVKTVESD